MAKVSLPAATAVRSPLNKLTANPLYILEYQVHCTVRTFRINNLGQDLSTINSCSRPDPFLTPTLLVVELLYRYNVRVESVVRRYTRYWSTIVLEYWTIFGGAFDKEMLVCEKIIPYSTCHSKTVGCETL